MSTEKQKKAEEDFQAGIEWSATLVERTRASLDGATPGVLKALDNIVSVLREFAPSAAKVHALIDQGASIWSPGNSQHH